MKKTLFSKFKAAMAVAAATVVNKLADPLAFVAGKALVGSKERPIPPREWLERFINDARRAAAVRRNTKYEPIELAPTPTRVHTGGLRYDQVQRRNAVPKFRKVNYSKEGARAHRQFWRVLNDVA